MSQRRHQCSSASSASSLPLPSVTGRTAPGRGKAGQGQPWASQAPPCSFCPDGRLLRDCMRVPPSAPLRCRTWFARRYIERAMREGAREKQDDPEARRREAKTNAVTTRINMEHASDTAPARCRHVIPLAVRHSDGRGKSLRMHAVRSVVCTSVAIPSGKGTRNAGLEFSWKRAWRVYCVREQGPAVGEAGVCTNVSAVRVWVVIWMSTVSKGPRACLCVRAAISPAHLFPIRYS